MFAWKASCSHVDDLGSSSYSLCSHVPFPPIVFFYTHPVTKSRAAQTGGAFGVSGGTLVIDSCRLLENSAGVAGGALSIAACSNVPGAFQKVVLRNTTIADCFAALKGGAISIQESVCANANGAPHTELDNFFKGLLLVQDSKLQRSYVSSGDGAGIFDVETHPSLGDVLFDNCLVETTAVAGRLGSDKYRIGASSVVLLRGKHKDAGGFAWDTHSWGNPALARVSAQCSDVKQAGPPSLLRGFPCPPYTLGDNRFALDSETKRSLPLGVICSACGAGTAQVQAPLEVFADAASFPELPALGWACSCPAGFETSSAPPADLDRRKRCTACPAGRYFAFAKTTEATCHACNPGQYQDEAGQSACKLCPGGRFLSTIAASSLAACTGCAAGKTSLQASQLSSACTPCPAGSNAPAIASASCSQCDAGKFARTTASRSCDACPASKYQHEKGQAFCLAVQPCTPGKFVSAMNGVVRVCSACQAGHFSNANNQQSCTACANNTFQSQTGKLFCAPQTTCVAGQRVVQAGSDVTDRVCEECPAQSYSDTNNAASCTACPAVELQDKPGQLRCQPTDPNTYVRVWNATHRTLVDCPFIQKADPEAECGFGALTFKDGFWHDGLTAPTPGANNYTSFMGRMEPQPSKLQFYPCPCADCCSYSDKKTGAFSCTGGTNGPLCAVCPDSYFHVDGKNSRCASCADEKQSLLSFVGACVGLLLLLGGLARQVWKNMQAAEKKRAMSGQVKPFNKWAGFSLKRMRPVFKQFISFYQVVALFKSVYSVPYPKFYTDAVSFLTLFEFDVAQIFRMECTVGYSWHDTFYSSLIAFFVLTATQAALLFVLEIMIALGSTSPAVLELMSSIASAAILITFGLCTSSRDAARCCAPRPWFPPATHTAASDCHIATQTRPSAIRCSRHTIATRWTVSATCAPTTRFCATPLRTRRCRHGRGRASYSAPWGHPP
jgi:hypothetical protein